MTPERWRQIEELFQTAVDLPPSERPRFIRQASAGDETLFEQVVALVNQYESAGDFIEEPALNQSQLHPTDPFEKASRSHAKMAGEVMSKPDSVRAHRNLSEAVQASRAARKCNETFGEMIM